MLVDYFKNGRYETALKAYAGFAREQDWRMSYRAELYGCAQDAFNSSLPLEQRRIAFEEVYDGVSKDQGFRNSTGGHWNADDIFNTLTVSCKPASRATGRSLASLRQAKDVLAVEDAVGDLAEIKVISEYPHMVASKFLHFFNPRLFPIYDKKVIWNKVLCGPFKSEWQRVCDQTGIRPYETTGAFNVSYTRWAAEHIQASDDGLMPYFSEWFIQEARIGADELTDLKSYQATAFEFVAIGAMTIVTGGV